jgi:hypothetical protein
MQVFNILNLWQVSDLGTTVSFTNKTGRHDITEILLKVALITIALTPNMNNYVYFFATNIVTKKLCDLN